MWCPLFFSFLFPPQWLDAIQIISKRPKGKYKTSPSDSQINQMRQKVCFALLLSSQWANADSITGLWAKDLKAITKHHLMTHVFSRWEQKWNHVYVRLLSSWFFVFCSLTQHHFGIRNSSTKSREKYHTNGWRKLLIVIAKLKVEATESCNIR